MIVEELVQLLTPEGERVQHPEYDTTLSGDEIFGLYRDMVIVRRLCNESTSLQRQGQLALWAPIQGQEAAQIGAGRALAPMDFTFPTYREHGIAWCRGVPPEDMLKLFRAVSNGGGTPRSTGTRSRPSCSGTRRCTRWATPWASSATAPRRP